MSLLGGLGTLYLQAGKGSGPGGGWVDGKGRRRTRGKARAVFAEKKTGCPAVSELEGRHAQRESLAVSK